MDKVKQQELTKPYFQDALSIQRLKSCCAKWEGTPYLHMGANKFGVDCTKVIALIFQELEVISQVDRVRFSRDWFQHTKEEKALDEFLRHISEYGVQGQMYSLQEDLSEVAVGDVLFFKMHENSPCNHTALLLEGNLMFHAIDGLGCHYTEFGIYWRKKFKRAMRVLECVTWE